MRIKQLELSGFKSFARRAVLEIPAGVTAVVGPNGCGKSNIVDAIRWVLGEQSPKHLRGDAMEAVIFNGNHRLAPLGMAEVTLTFESNGAAHRLSDFDLELSSVPAHIRDLSEIAITRRYLRSGESEYLINKIPCRLKDITELFLGTGVGSKAYGIIEQGRVEEVLKAKPEDRRLLIEEAAGTTLYRSRRLAAERKMERTRENLSRVNDVLSEIERQVRSLERQARKAERYRRLRDEARELELTLAVCQWQDLTGELERLEASRTRLAAAEEDARRDLESGERRHERAAAAVATAEKRQVAVREAIAVLEAERQSVRERAELLERESGRREERRERMTEDLEATRAGFRTIETRVAEAVRECDGLALELDAGERRLAEEEAKLAAARSAVNDAQAGLESAKNALVDHVALAAQCRNTLGSIEERREDVARRLARLKEEAEVHVERLRDTEHRMGESRDGLAALREQMAGLSGEKEARAEKVRTLSETRRRWQREAAEVESSLMQARSRLESLEKIQANYEGFSPGVRAIMRQEQHVDGVLGVVADVIDIPEDYQRAVAAVLGDRLQYVIVEGEEHGAGAVGLLRREECGRGSFIPREPRPGDLHGAESLNGSSQCLLDVVRIDEDFRSVAESLLGGAVLVPDLESAIGVWRKNGVRVTLVTPEGDVMDPTGVITGGSDRPIEEEILSRRREIDGLKGTVEDLGKRSARSRDALARSAQSVADEEAALQSLDEGLHELTLQIVAVEKDLERLEAEKPQCESRRDVVQYEIEGLRADDGKMLEESERLRGELADLGERQGTLQADVARLQEESTRVREHEAVLQNAVTGVKIRVAECRERQQAAAAAAESLRGQRADLARREKGLLEDLRIIEEERESLGASLAEARAREIEQDRRSETLHSELEAADSEIEDLRQALHSLVGQVRAVRTSLESARKELGQVELSRSEVRLRREHLGGSMREKYATELEEYAAQKADAEAPSGGSERLEELRQSLSRLGEVNVAAIDELRELQERGEFLRTQREDLERSLQDLERTIQKLNRVSRSRFAETFARANETFQKIFPRLFQGGEARLVLTDEHNLLETGVDILVRPPGKRLDGVGLLSGGEKALVAVSLIFALFLINPTPFCILDEVDAPLDDANVGRFTQLIREMSEHSQFVIMTHNKRTMETANALYGVTMQEPGVSTLVSVHMS